MISSKQKHIHCKQAMWPPAKIAKVWLTILAKKIGLSLGHLFDEFGYVCVKKRWPSDKPIFLWELFNEIL